MTKLLKLLSVTVLVAALAGCASTGEVGGSSDETTGAAPGAGASSYPYGRGGGVSGQAVTGGPEASVADRVVYFDFDSAEIRSDSLTVIEANARYLVANPASIAVLEGHSDERGTREYNIGLGERRAQAVQRAMVAYGVSPQQMRTVSYGEERPAVAGQDESSYEQNRRVEIAYSGNL